MSEKRVILITGASGGIGRSCSVALSKAYPSEQHPEKLVLVLVGRRQPELEETAKLLREGTEVEIAIGDAAKDEDVKRIFDTVKEKYGRLDVLFNVSGELDDSKLALQAKREYAVPNHIFISSNTH
jgi:short-subunit dehydrogenase